MPDSVCGLSHLYPQKHSEIVPIISPLFIAKETKKGSQLSKDSGWLQPSPGPPTSRLLHRGRAWGLRQPAHHCPGPGDSNLSQQSYKHLFLKNIYKSENKGSKY